MSEHASTPWTFEGPLKPGNTYRIRSARGLVAYVGDPATVSFDRANAALIVRAVNSHDALVKALEGIAEFCSTDANTLGAIERLAHIRNTALNMLGHVGNAVVEK